MVMIQSRATWRTHLVAWLFGRFANRAIVVGRVRTRVIVQTMSIEGEVIAQVWLNPPQVDLLIERLEQERATVKMITG